MEPIINKVMKEIKIKWINICKENKNLSVEKKVQKIVEIPLKDIKNILNIR